MGWGIEEEEEEEPGGGLEFMGHLRRTLSKVEGRGEEGGEVGCSFGWRQFGAGGRGREAIDSLPRSSLLAC